MKEDISPINLMDESILFYVKFPMPGQVKTRLAKDLGDEFTLNLYRCVVLDMLDMLGTLPQRICICYTPESAENDFRIWLGDEYLYFPQQGNDLGLRMEDSFRQAFQKGFEKAALIGSDLPGLPSEILVQAFEQLNAYESVIGPSNDGGYYLIGFRNSTLCPEIFHDMRWSQPSVYRETMARFGQQGVNVFSLPDCDDIDNLHELQLWYAQHQHDPFAAPQTLAYIRRSHDLRQRIIMCFC